MKVICIGELLTDMICTDQGVTLEKGQHFLKKPGGAPANVAAAIAALGGDTAIAACVGNDPFGRQLIDEMMLFGVDTQYVRIDQVKFTTLAFVSLMQNGERDFVFSRGADSALSVADTEEIPLSGYDILHFGSATAFLPGNLQTAYLNFFNKGIRNQKFTSFDPNYRDLLYGDNKDDFIRQVRYFIKHCQFFKVSEEEACLITGELDPVSAGKIFSSMTDAVYCITLGAKGTLLSVKSDIEIIPSIPVHPVDTTGAGDAFMGAVLYQLSCLDTHNLMQLSFEEWKKIVANANKAGARTCEFIGAMEAYRHLSDQILKIV
jgi:fructokinase